MDRRSKLIAAWAILGLLVSAVWFVVARGDTDQKNDATPPSGEHRESAEDEPAEPPLDRAAEPESAAVVTPPTVKTAPSASQGAAPDEASLMATLRELRGTNPILSLRLAREGNARFGDNQDAAERTWFVVKSLSDLGRHDEARDEARLMVEKFRGTSWAHNVYRHMLVHPPDHPSERGHGKQLELEETPTAR